MVHDERLAPLGPVRAGLLRAVADARVEKQVVQPVITQLRTRLAGEGADAAQVAELEGQDVEGVGLAVEGEGVVGLAGALGVARAEDDPVGLGLLEELLDGLEALLRLFSMVVVGE